MIEASFAGAMASFALKVFESSLALIVAVAFALMGVVVAVKLAEIAPAGTVTVEGTVTDVREELSEMTIPAVPAFLDTVTVPVAEFPPMTGLGVREIREMDCPKPIDSRQAQSKPIAINRLPK